MQRPPATGTAWYEAAPVRAQNRRSGPCPANRYSRPQTQPPLPICTAWRLRTTVAIYPPWVRWPRLCPLSAAGNRTPPSVSKSKFSGRASAWLGPAADRGARRGELDQLSGYRQDAKEMDPAAGAPPFGAERLRS